MTSLRSFMPSALEVEDYPLLAAILLLPWAFGGVGIWAYRGAAFAIVLAASIALWRRGPAGLGLGDGKSRWLIPAFLLAAWAGLQLAPLPPGITNWLSPEAQRIAAHSLPGAPGTSPEEVFRALEEKALGKVPEAVAHPWPGEPALSLSVDAPACLTSGWRPVSLEPSATQEMLSWYIALLLGFLLARCRTADREVFVIYRGCLLVMFAALAVFGLVQAQTWNGKLYWFKPTRATWQPFGPYVNPIHFAGVMELAVPALAGYAWARLRRGGRAALREARFALSSVAAVICLVAGFAAASKAAAALLAGTLIVLGVAGARSWKTRLIVILVAVLVAAGVAGILSSSRLGERMESFLSRTQQSYLLGGRLTCWEAGMGMIRDFPVTGSGYGTFREVFPGYMPQGLHARLARAHNDYLEVLVDGGIVGALLVIWLALGYATQVGGALRSLPIGQKTAQLGLAVGVLSLAVHAFFDFNHQIPANALLFVTVAALALHRPPHTARSAR